ncbi:MAG: hypothetical protein AAF410_02820 [Pseudomonadota bacterium]
MSLATINTILNTAPIVIQGAKSLIKLIRDQGDENLEEIPDTIEGIKHEVERLNQRIDANKESDLEQIKLIEELAKQNESLATQLKSTMSHLNRITYLSILALFVSLISIVIVLI